MAEALRRAEASLAEAEGVIAALRAAAGREAAEAEALRVRVRQLEDSHLNLNLNSNLNLGQGQGVVAEGAREDVGDDSPGVLKSSIFRID